jgi:hypothetical protein
MEREHVVSANAAGHAAERAVLDAHAEARAVIVVERTARTAPFAPAEQLQTLRAVVACWWRKQVASEQESGCGAQCNV